MMNRKMVAVSTYRVYESSLEAFCWRRFLMEKGISIKL